MKTIMEHATDDTVKALESFSAAVSAIDFGPIIALEQTMHDYRTRLNAVGISGSAQKRWFEDAEQQAMGSPKSLEHCMRTKWQDTIRLVEQQ